MLSGLTSNLTLKHALCTCIFLTFPSQMLKTCVCQSSFFLVQYSHKLFMQLFCKTISYNWIFNPNLISTYDNFQRQSAEPISKICACYALSSGNCFSTGDWFSTRVLFSTGNCSSTGDWSTGLVKAAVVALTLTASNLEIYKQAL